MKAISIILLASILVVSIVGINEYKDEKPDIIFHNFSNAYDQIVEKVTLSYNDFIDKYFKPPEYKFEIIEAVKLKDCVQNSFDNKDSCLLVNLDIKNDENDSVSFEITERTIVTKDGRQIEKYGGLLNTRELNGLCDTPNYFKLFPNANKKVGICFPEVRKDEMPIMYIGVTANGKRQEHSFDLTSFLGK